MNTEFKWKLTPKDDKAVYSQSLPMLIRFKKDLIVELVLMHKYGIITVLPFSEYASPIFAQRKPNGKLRLFVDLRKINSMIADDYTNNNHPVSTLSDAAQHLAGKSLFCKLDCSQAYHCFQMADQWSVELLAFNFARRSFDYKRLAQGLSRSVSAFLSFMRGYLELKAEKPNKFYELLKTDVPVNITSELKETFDSVNKALSDACQTTLNQPNPGKQLVLMTDASSRSAGYALMIEDNPDQKVQSKRKTYNPCQMAQKFSPPHNLKCPYTQKSFWQSIWHFLSLHAFCGKQERHLS